MPFIAVLLLFMLLFSWEGLGFFVFCFVGFFLDIASGTRTVLDLAKRYQAACNPCRSSLCMDRFFGSATSKVALRPQCFSVQRLQHQCGRSAESGEMAQNTAGPRSLKTPDYLEVSFQESGPIWLALAGLGIIN